MHSLLVSLIVGVNSHGSMSVPPSRNGGSLEVGSDIRGGVASWYVAKVHIPGDATLPLDLLTRPEDWQGAKNPWRAPGTAPILSPCGTGCKYGKDPWDAAGSPECVDPSTHVDGWELPTMERLVWKQGDNVEVAWSPSIQHGGGYAYRLCPASNERPDEACFQQLDHHLEFVDDFHTVHWTADGFEETIPAKRTKVGTFPAGSHWSMNPIPVINRGPPSPFPDPCKHHSCGVYPGPDSKSKPESSYTIKDRVKVPMHLEPGNYTVSWRWDCEGSAQVWTNCGDVEIVGQSCPGGALSQCIGMCPTDPSTAYKICVDVCEQRCSSTVV